WPSIRYPPGRNETILDHYGFFATTPVKGPLRNDFAQFDLNKDGYLTESEMPKGPPPL
ncbi:hypothetical protein SAMN02745132_04772, partial [Enterovibrio nigricans DSM 22720]